MGRRLPWRQMVCQSCSHTRTSTDQCVRMVCVHATPATIPSTRHNELSAPFELLRPGLSLSGRSASLAICSHECGGCSILANGLMRSRVAIQDCTRTGRHGARRSTARQTVRSLPQLSFELHSTTHCTENCHLDTAPNGFSGFGLFTCWVALSEVGPDSAPLQFVRGSHRWGVKYQDKATHRQDRATQQRKYACTHARVPLCQHGESWCYKCTCVV